MAQNNLKIPATIFLFLFTFSTSFAQECSSDYSALVLDIKSGNVLFEKQPDKIIFPASLTKLMTIYLTFEALKKKKLDLEDELFASERAASTSMINKSNTLHLKFGDKVSVKQAIEGSIVRSYNELTIMLAEKISGDEWQFARDMNLKAVELGMFSTSFRNASGLHNQGQFTDGEDLAKLVLAIKNDFPEYYYFFLLKKFSYKNLTYPSHNYILLNYKGADGLKTGFTNAAGFNMIASAKQKNQHIVSILTGCESSKKRDKFTAELLDRAFAKLE